MIDPKVVIIGAGIAGLNCAYHLQQAGVPVVVFEKESSVGGRIKSSVYQGFIIDEGFQVLLDSYPELRSFNQLERLRLKPFPSGARLVSGNISGILLNPYDSPSFFIKNLIHFPLRPVDFWVLWSIWRDSARVSDVFYAEKESESTMAYLKRKGVRQELLDAFFRPFFGGVFLDPELETGSRYFLWLFRKFGQGKACLPAGGMARFPAQLAESLLPGTVQTGLRLSVEKDEGEVLIDHGKRLSPSVLVIATGTTETPAADTRMAHTVYLKCSGAQGKWGSLIWLNGNPKGLVLHLCFPSLIQAGYAPDDSSLCAISILPQKEKIGEEGFRNLLLPQLQADFPDVDWASCTFLTETLVPRALPKYGSGSPQAFGRKGTVWEVGDAFTYPSINGALESGRKAAEDILKSGLV